MGYALDRQAIVDGVFFGQGAPILGGNIPSWSWAYDSGVHKFGPHADVAKAKQYLAQSSVPNGFDAVFLSPTGSAIQNNQGPIIQQNLKAIGINITLATEDDPRYENDLFTTRSFDVIDDLWLSPLVDPDDFTYLIMYGGADTNIIGYDNPQMNALIDAGRATPDQAKRKEIYSSVQKLQMDDYTFMFTVNANVLHSYNRRLQNYVPDRNGFVRSLRDTWFA
jgi:peptide/nickel transport system substrate-binding protein